MKKSPKHTIESQLSGSHRPRSRDNCNKHRKEKSPIECGRLNLIYFSWRTMSEKSNIVLRHKER
ncbi:Uncharacterized protein APZ42_021557 [Daphnia magna]|uniref:Uncharacterized protein n=1 Tax=Daphnia magna TaxID=35525 RepID=A0A164WKB3_9CRUS|nr:Uncharacterized protein APZ42_021557 [Daphnia magna]